MAWDMVTRVAPLSTAGFLGLSVLAGLSPVGAAWLTKLVLDGLTGPRPGTVWLAVALAGTGVAGMLLPQLIRYTEAELGRRVRVTATDRLFGAVNERLRGLSRLEEPAFHDRIRLAQQAGSSGPGQLLGCLTGISQSALTLAGFLTTLLVIDPLLALAVAAAALPALHAEFVISRRRAAAMWRIGHAERREFFYADLLTSPQEAKEIRLFGLGSFFRERMLREQRTANAAHRRLDRRELATQSALALLGSVVAGAGLVWAVRAALSGTLTIGDVAVLAAAVAGVHGGLASLVGQLGMAHHALLLLDHYRVVTAVEPDLPVLAGPAPVPSLRKGIELRGVWFRYAPDHPWVLRGVDLTIPAGRATALVGLNGAGKSTLVKLLCRLYDPTRGAILWDGVDLRDCDPAELRRRIGAVFQDYVSYEMSAAENIGVGDLGRLEDRTGIRGAAERAGIHDRLAALPSGYDTLLTRMYLDNADRDDAGTGVLLSGGQGQRLALARGFLRDGCDLIVLDEPSSGLDAEAEAEIHARLREHRAGRTSLLISHRLNTVRDADQIVVLTDGRVAELGTHPELLLAEGGYARLFTLQARGYEEVR